jgi:hypothetical protein
VFDPWCCGVLCSPLEYLIVMCGLCCCWLVCSVVELWVFFCCLLCSRFYSVLFPVGTLESSFDWSVWFIKIIIKKN